jgi:hypothetical protein
MDNTPQEKVQPQSQTYSLYHQYGWAWQAKKVSLSISNSLIRLSDEQNREIFAVSPGQVEKVSFTGLNFHSFQITVSGKKYALALYNPKGGMIFTATPLLGRESTLQGVEKTLRSVIAKEKFVEGKVTTRKDLYKGVAIMLAIIFGFFAILIILDGLGILK